MNSLGPEYGVFGDEAIWSSHSTDHKQFCLQTSIMVVYHFLLQVQIQTGIDCRCLRAPTYASFTEFSQSSDTCFK